MNDTALANEASKLVNTKERLIYHLIRTVTAGWSGDWDNEGYEALSFLKELGYSKNDKRWKFMLDSGEPGTHEKPVPGGAADRAVKIEQALNGMLATLSTARQGGQLGHSEQISRAIGNAEKALE